MHANVKFSKAKFSGFSSNNVTVVRLVLYNLRNRRFLYILHILKCICALDLIITKVKERLLQERVKCLKLSLQKFTFVKVAA